MLSWYKLIASKFPSEALEIVATIKGVDDNYKNAWTIASDRLREAADEYIETENAFEMQRASTDYFNSCVAFASEYKKQKNKNSTEMFLESMNEKQRRS